MSNKQQDVLATIELYKIRSGEKMRAARKWFMTEFQPQTASEITQLLLSGEEESSNYRMVTSYWETAASFVNNGGIDEKIFLEANTEHIVIYAKIRPFIKELRETFNEPHFYQQLETLVLKIPNVEHLLANRERLFERWAKRKD